jgi:class 3 adenylate cyclase
MRPCHICGTALPAEARFCSSCGAPLADTAPTTERKLVSILFADLVGSTAFASGEDPERVRSILDDFYALMAEEAVAAGGTVEKFAGDAVLAAFGASTAQEDHAERALHAALAMRRRFAERFGDGFGVRIGVNTGEVAVGPARVGGSFLSGDAVNVAARLEQAAPPGEVLASERTVAAARGAFEFGERETIVAKGKDEGIGCRRVLRALSLQRPRGIRGRDAAFVGRESELDLLRATFRRCASQREPALVTLLGEPGVGKTRLARELWELLSTADPPPLLRVGRCPPYGDGITYLPLADVLREHFGFRDGASPAEVSAHLGEERILGLALGLDVAAGIHPLEAREQLHAAVVAFLERVSAEHALVVVIEDVHWAEDDLLDLLDRVVREARGPLLILATARPELHDRRPHWGSGQRNSATVWLEPLHVDETGRLVDELLAGAVSDTVRELVVQRAEGNPFFVEELVGALLDTGMLQGEGEEAGGSPDLLAVPDSVHAVLAARIDRLPAAEKAALQAAGVVGRGFSLAAVAHLLEGASFDLDVLEERDFVRRLAVSEIAAEHDYAFKHALTRDVAYLSIPKARRGRLHAALADWLASRDGGRDDSASLLAYHYSEAARPEDADLVWAGDGEELERVRTRAVHWLSRAGALARGRHEIVEAVELYARAAELSGDPHERALLWREVGEAQALRYDGEAMRAALQRSLEGPLDTVERADTYALLAFQSSLRSSMWSIRLNRSLIESWADAAMDLAPPASEARVRAVLARVHVDPDALPEEAVAEAAAAAETLGSRELRSYGLSARSVIAFEHRRFADAVTWTERRLELVADIDDPDHRCEAYETAAPVYAAMARFDEAREMGDRHEDLARRLSPHHRVHAVSLGLELADVLGDWQALADETDRVQTLVQANLATPCVRNPRDLLLCAAGHLITGDESRAVELERAAARVGGEGYESYLSGPRLRLALARGDRAVLQELVALPVERVFVWGVGALAARLDALVALGRADLVEREAPVLASAGTLLEPFALRALGAARRDGALLSCADDRFASLRLGWHRAQTERLLAGL